MQVPKVKLGDRISALQQIVSPFGKVNSVTTMCILLYLLTMKIKKKKSIIFFKMGIINFSSFFLGVNFQTDTASVLLEAIQYIKFLQEQVQVIIIHFLHKLVTFMVASFRI